MAKGKKTNPEKIAAVINNKIANPDISLRDLEKETGVKKDTANNIIKEEIESIDSLDTVKKLVDLNTELIIMGRERILADAKSRPINSWSDNKQFDSIVETAFKQNQLLGGGVTENVGVINASIEIIKP